MFQHEEDSIRLKKAYDVIVRLEEKLQQEKELKSEPIAVVGIGCKFPGNVESVEDFYQLLANGKNTVGTIPDKRWNFDQYDKDLADKIYCRRGAFLSDVYGFDPLFFNISPLEAEYMDPQQRIFLEVCWRALEDAGYTRKMIQDVSCGVYAGVVSNDYFGYLDKLKHKVEAYEVIGNYNSMLSARISYFLNLKGPAITVDTACSSSAVAIHLACQAIKNGDCEMALAGGVTLYLTPRPYLLMCESNMLSKSGETYAFDDRADGFIPGEGCGVVVLKTLSKALINGDHIYGLIRETGVNQDGKSNGITAPSVLAQQELEIRMFEKSKLNPDQITYIETHGTGTELGDPIEIDALTQSYQNFTDKKQFCAIGSLKPNIGHLQAAAGVASLIKVMLSLEYKKLFPTINFKNENHHINLKNSAFYVQKEYTDWKVGKEEIRRAAINAFGFSGTNVNILTEEYIVKQDEQHNQSVRYFFPLSATTQTTLRSYVKELKKFIKQMSSRKVNKEKEEITEFIRSNVAKLYSLKQEEIDLQFDWECYTNDSVKIHQFLEIINEKFELQIDLPWLISLSNGKQLCDYIMNNSIYLERNFLYHLAATFQLRRTQMKERALFIVNSIPELLQQINSYEKKEKQQSQWDLRNEKEEFCVKSWIAGRETDWSSLYERIPQCISAPVYPFDNKEYLVIQEKNNEIVWENSGFVEKTAEEITAWEQEYLLPERKTDYNSHIVGESEILPAAYIITLIWEACHLFWPDKIFEISHTNFQRPLYVGGAAKVRVTARKGGSNIVCSLISGQDNHVYATSEIIFIDEAMEENHKIIPEHVNNRNSEKNIEHYVHEEWYQLMKSKGFGYGKLYQLVEKLEFTESCITASLTEREREEEIATYQISPYLLDASIQPVVALIEKKCKEFALAIPKKIGCLYVLGNLSNQINCYTQFTGCQGENQYNFNIYITNINMEFIAKIEDVVIHVVPKEEKSPNIINPKKENHLINDTCMNTVIHYLKNEIAEITKTKLEDIEVDQPFQNYGLDSFLSLKVIERLEKKLGKLPKTVLFEYFNIKKLAKYLLGRFPEQFERSEHQGIKKQLTANKNINKARLISEISLKTNENDRIIVEKLRQKFEAEGLAYARREIAPDIFMGANDRGFFYIAVREQSVLAFLYVGDEACFNETAEELESAFLGYHIYYLLPRKMEQVGKRALQSVSIGALQRMNYLPDSLNGKQYRHLRYAVNSFEKQGECETHEYRINTEDKIDNQIIEIIDEWISHKRVVNPYIKQVKEQIMSKTFPKEYRFFITTIDSVMQNVIVITPLPSNNGYLMDLEFYGDTMPFGGLEYAIIQIYMQLKQEGVTEFSLGATFGVNADMENSNDQEWSKALEELIWQGIFDGSGNYQFKNKFRTTNIPLYLNRFLDDTQGNIIDVIMFIADPVGKEGNVIDISSSIFPETIPLEGYYANTLYLPSDKIKFDLLTDSWSELSKFANSMELKQDYHEVNDMDLVEALQKYFPFPYIIPVSSGRYAESLLFSSLDKEKKTVIQNVLFPTTRWNIKEQGYKINEVPMNNAGNPYYSGDLDIELLQNTLHGSDVGYAVIELANNAGGGSNISYDNLKHIAQLCHNKGAYLFIDATRAIGNAYAVAKEDANMGGDVLITLQKLLKCADGVFASLTKEYAVSKGGLIAINDVRLCEKISRKLMLQGSGLSKTDKSILFQQIIDTKQIIAGVKHRIEAVKRISKELGRYLPIVVKPESHCILVDVMKIPELSNYKYPAQVFANWFYQYAEIRAGVHSGGDSLSKDKDRYVRFAVPVGLSKDEVENIIQRISLLKAVEKKFRKISLLKPGPEEFGIIKNQYQFIKDKEADNSKETTYIDPRSQSDSLVAVIGMSGRYPKSDTIYQLWDNLSSGKDCITEIPESRWKYHNYFDPEKKSGKNPCKWGGFIEDVDKFDAQFFKISPYEAEKMDPQQRLFLLEAWHAIEDAGYKVSELREKTNRKVGVFAGATWSEYTWFTDEQADFYPEINIGSIATRTAYYLDFTGPVLTVDTHCSSSLTALYLAYESIIHGNCKVALAGGVNLSLKPNKYQFAKHFLSAQGRCKSFSAKADGYVPSEGVGVVILKSLSQAIADHDHIYGVMKGATLGHGGKTGGVTVPNSYSQADVIRETYKKANIDPRTIGYIEAHGTGTPLGDPIEINGLTQAFGDVDKKEYCAVGSIKSNIGHTEAASGISQLMKVLLQLKYKKIVPSLFANELNREIDFSSTPFYVQTKLTDWELVDDTCDVRRAGISSFGAGGVNCHVVVEEYPAKNQLVEQRERECTYVVPISAKSLISLQDYVKDLGTYLSRDDMTPDIQDIAYTLQTGREVFKERIAFLAKSKEELIQLCHKYLMYAKDANILGMSPAVAGGVDKKQDFLTQEDKEVFRLANAYVSGEDINWMETYGEEYGKKVSLPGYSFEKVSFWAPKKVSDECLANDQDEIANFLCETPKILVEGGEACSLYSTRRIPESTNRPIEHYDKFVIFENDEMLAKELINIGKTVVRVRKGTAYICVQKNSYQLNPKVKDDYTKLFKDIGINSKTRIVYDWIDGDEIADTDYKLLIEYLLLFFQTLNRYAMEEPVSVLCLATLLSEENGLIKRALSVFMKTIHLESSYFGIRLVLLKKPMGFNILYEKELTRKITKSSTVCYDSENATTEGYVLLDNQDRNKQTVLKPNGVYLITGGIKGIGYLIAQSFAQTRSINLILAGRSKLNNEIQKKIAVLEHRHAKVVYVEADVASKADTMKLIELIKNQFGRIDGIVHSAGALKDSYFVKKTMDEVNQVLLPKVDALRNLDEVTANEKLDFIVAFSSLAAIAGNIGQCDYSYANAYMDQYMEYRARLCAQGLRHGSSISINWPLWEEGGMNIPAIKKELLFEQNGLLTLSTKDGLAAFYTAIASKEHRILVTVGNQDRIQASMLESQIMKMEPVASDFLKEDIYKVIKRLVSEETKLPVEKIDIQDPFEDYGMDSIMIESMVQKMEEYFGVISPTILFECQTIQELTEYLFKRHSERFRLYISKKQQSKNKSNVSLHLPRHSLVAAELFNDNKEDHNTQKENTQKEKCSCNESGIAIIGMNGRYPGANSIEELWNNLLNGKDSITEVPSDRWDIQKEETLNNIYCKWGGFLENVDLFDALLFNISPKEADTIDPQERLFLQNVWELMEQTGHTREKLEIKYPKGKGADIGVFVGETTNSYQLLMDESQGKDTVYPISSPWSIANRISYVFNLTGPSMSIDTACSSSLVAIHMACESLKHKECKMAIAGGVNLYFHKSKYAAMCQLGMLSKTGRCHAFGKDADGFVPAEGIGSILLKPLSDAIADGDKIIGVIRGTSVNHGGKTNGYKVPNAISQSLVIKEALDKAGVEIDDLSYIEAHGTGTSLGDPIEIEGLMQLYEEKDYRKNSCPIGSVKTNIGHAESAAGIAGLTKVLLQMKNRTIVPSLHSKELNPYIDFTNSPFYVSQEAKEWKPTNDDVMRAGISAFGAGGVNAHVIVEEYKDIRADLAGDGIDESGKAIFLFSAKELEQLKKSADRILKFINESKVNYKDLAYTLMYGREELEERLAIVAVDFQDLLYKLRLFLDGKEGVCIFHGNKNDNIKAFTLQENKALSQMLKREDYELVAAKWVLGARVDWSSAFTGERKMIELPTYPFALKSYWIPRKEMQSMLYLTPSWKLEQLQVSNPSFKNQKVMLVGTREQLRLQNMFEHTLGYGIDTVIVLGSCNMECGNSIFEIDVQHGDIDFSIAHHRVPDEIFFLGGLSQYSLKELDFKEYQEATQYGAFALISLLKTFSKNVGIKVLTNKSVSVTAAENVENIYSASLFGLCKTIVQEYRSVNLQCIDLSAKDINEVNEFEIQLAVTESDWKENMFLAYRENKRYKRILTQQVVNTKNNTILTMDGTYAVFGGMGGIGYLTAEYIARRYHANLLLIGRSELKDEKLHLIDNLRNYGTDIRYLQADISDVESVMELINRYINDNGYTIDGIIHAAAVVDNSLLRNMTREQFMKVVNLQMSSCFIMNRLRKEHNISNFIVYSSASSVFGNQGGANYSASNSLKDAFVNWFQHKFPVNMKIINWGLWSGVGLGKEFGDVLGRKFQSVIPISKEEGLEALDKVLHSDISHTFALTASRKYLVQETDLYDSTPMTDQTEKVVTQSSGKDEEMDITGWLKKIAADNLKMNPEDIHVQVPLGEYGMDSVVGINILNDLTEAFGDMPSTFMYEHYTIASIKEYLLKEKGINNYFASSLGKAEVSKEVPSEITVPDNDIAIIGVAGIYPDAENLDIFWDNLINKRCSIKNIPSNRYNGDVYEKTGKIYSNFGGFIDHCEDFDPLFFQISPKEGKGIDPQERLFLQNAYHTFNDAGYTKEALSNQRVGVFVGVTNNTYQMQGVENFVTGVEEAIPFAQSYSVANRVSYTFNLKGPSMVIDTACSSSLAAIHMACESLMSKDCTIALAGGVNLYLHPYKYASLCQMNMISETGKCSAFQETADGFVPGEGVGSILLKPLKQAIADGDNIQAVIKATAMNHGGRTNGYTVPNPKAQAELVTDALQKAHIDPRTIGYVEAHGTGTALGDPIEIAGLTMAYGQYTKDKNYCSLGSVKTNIGHLEAASGIVSITKVLLQMKHKKLAASYITDPINSRIALQDTPFYLQTETTEWNRMVLEEEGMIKRRAAISSFGAGGANVHVIMEEYCTAKEGEDGMQDKNIVILSAKSKEQVKTMAGKLLAKLEMTPNKAEYSLNNIAYTLQTGRDEYEERLAIIADSLYILKEELKIYVQGEESINRYEGSILSGAKEGKALDFHRNCDFHQYAKEWVKGNKINWNIMYQNNPGRIISLPGYEFIRKPLMIQTSEQNYPLIRELSGEEDILKDHVINGKKVFPGAAYLDFIMAALKPSYPNNNYRLHNIKFESVLEVDHSLVTLSAMIQKKGKEIVTVESMQLTGRKTAHAECFIDSVLEPEHVNIEAIKAIIQTGYLYDGQFVYENYHKLGIKYGSSFKGIHKIYVQENRAVAELSPSVCISRERQNHIIYPGLLDSVLQTVIGFHMNKNNIVMLPYYIGTLLPVNIHSNWCYVYICKTSSQVDKYDITVLDDQFNIVCQIKEFLVRTIQMQDSKNNELDHQAIVVEKKVASIEGDHTLSHEIKRIIADLLELQMDEIDHDTEFGDYGFDSLSFTKLCDVMNEKYQVDITPATLFEYPTLNTLSDYMNKKYYIRMNHDKAAKGEVFETLHSGSDEHGEYRDDVAIIGIAGKLPMSDDLSEYWGQLIQGKDFIEEIPKNRWDWKEYYGNPNKEKNKTKAKWGGFLSDIDKFDAPFFHISNHEAELMDPQQRIMLELTWNAVEDAGYSMQELSGSNIGVIIGVASNNEYNNLLNSKMEETKVYQSTGVASSVLTNRISFMFNWHGLSEPVDTACSSSLVAIHRAVMAMKNGECELAVAGGTNLILTPKGAVSFDKAGMLSEEGRCKTFSSSANGYVRSEGMGLVLLKPLQKAIQDHDNIYAVIRGSAVNHGGKGNAITSPNPNAQAQVIVDAMKRANIDFSMVDFIETHGTGTKIGDVIEVNGLKKAYRMLPGLNRINKIALTGVKANVGHMETAAGMASLFKVLFAFQNHRIPKQIHIETVNPNIDFEECPFFICEKGMEWKNKTLTAGISSFGFGGVNSHIVLEEYVNDKTTYTAHRTKFFIPLSAKREDDLHIRAKLLLKEISSSRIQTKKSLTPIDVDNTMEEKIITLISEILQIPPLQISKDMLFIDMGFDTVTIGKLNDEINTKLGIVLPLKSLMSMESVEQVMAFIREMKLTYKEKDMDVEDMQSDNDFLTELEYTLLTGRNHMEVRAAFLVESFQDLVNQLKAFIEHNEIMYYGKKEKVWNTKIELPNSHIAKLMNSDGLEELIKNWIAGAELDFQSALRSKGISRMHLPGYPFARFSYWFDDSFDKNSEEVELVDSDKEGYEYCAHLDSMFDLFADHVINKKIILPGAFSIDLLTSIGKRLYGAEALIKIENLYWLSPLELINKKESVLYISIEKKLNTKIKVVSFTSSGKVTHIQAEISSNTNNNINQKIDISEFTTEPGQEIEIAELYDLCRKNHFEYGTAFQTLSQLKVIKHIGFAVIKRNDNNTFHSQLHPAMIDGAFQAIAGINMSNQEESAYLPYAVKSVSVWNELPPSCYVIVKEVEATHDMRKYSILITDKEGNLLIEFQEFTIKVYEVIKEQSELCYFTTQYRKKNLENSINQSCECLHISLCEKGDTFINENVSLLQKDEIISAVETRSKHNEVVKLIVALRGEEAENMNSTFYESFEFIRMMMRRFHTINVTFAFVYKVSNKDSANKALAGFMRTVSMENSNYRIKLIGMEQYREDIVLEEIQETNQSFADIRYIGKERYVKELVEWSNTEIYSQHLLKKNGTYLLVGGNGGIGYIVADYLLREYQARVLILCRSQKKDERFNDIPKEYEANITFYYGDITDMSSAEAAFHKVKNENSDINGVFHLAGALNDSVILHKNEKNIAKVINPKTIGLKNLDLLTQKEKLDFFCTFSSVTAVNGNVGQADYAYANSFLDEFISKRMEMVQQGQRSGKSITINWPFWEAGGMTLDQAIIKLQYKQFGIKPLSANGARNALETALNSELSNIAVFYGEKEKIRKALNTLETVSDVIKNKDGSVLPDQIENLKLELTKLFAKVLKIDEKSIDTSEDLELYGFNSLMMMDALEKLETLLQDSTINPSIINDYKTIDNITDFIIKNTEFLQTKQQEKQICSTDIQEILVNHSGTTKPVEEEDERIAVVGMACRFPGAKNQEEYFNNLMLGKDLISEVPIDRWDVSQYYSLDNSRKDSTVSKWGSFIEDIDLFDADYFGLTQTDALVMDPQQRLMLELSEELMCNSGYDKEELSGKEIGVFLGASESTYVKDHLHHVTQEGMKHIVVGTIQNMIAARISDYYNLKGPSLVVDTACSSSLVAIDEAIRHLKDGSCNMAIAGGVQLLMDPVIHIGLSQAGVLTKENKTYVFDERAKGIILGEGAGVVMLKRVSQAIKDGDHIQAVILGSAVNNDGHTMGLTTPSLERQKEVIHKAVQQSGISPETISYYEAHGTGTLLGDPIEIKAASQVYLKFSEKRKFCAVGSVKANMGHLLRAAGIASFIKVVMSMNKDTIVKTINCEKPHPRFNFSDSPFYPLMENQSWIGINGYKRAAISSFGFGGTNCHMILEDYKEMNPNRKMRMSRPLPKYKKKVYWLGKNIEERATVKETMVEKENDIILRELLQKLKEGKITPEEALRTIRE